MRTHFGHSRNLINEHSTGKGKNKNKRVSFVIDVNGAPRTVFSSGGILSSKIME